MALIEFPENFFFSFESLLRIMKPISVEFSDFTILDDSKRKLH